MAHSVTLNAKIYLAQFDISGHANAHTIAHSIELPEDLKYGSTFKQRLVGVHDMNFSVAGNVDLAGATDTDTVMSSKMAVQDVPLIMCPVGSAVGDPCEFGLIAQGQYSPQATHGQIFKYGLTGNIANRKWVLGKVLWTPSASITGTGNNGAEVLLGAVSATQHLYIAIAVIAADLTSMEVKVQSDTTGFASPTDKVTFATVTDETAEMPAPVAGPNTDTFYRAIVSGFSGTSAQMIVAAGIA